MSGAINLGLEQHQVPYSHNAQSVGAAASNLGNIFDGATNNGVLIATGNNNGFSFTPINVTSKLEVYLRVNDADVMIEYYHDAHDRFYRLLTSYWCRHSV